MTAVKVGLFLLFLASAKVYSLNTLPNVSKLHPRVNLFDVSDLRKSDRIHSSNRLCSTFSVLNTSTAKNTELNRGPLNKFSPLLSLSVLLASFVALPIHPAMADSYFETLKATASESGLVQSFLLIFISELGDKTFFIAALLAGNFDNLHALFCVEFFSSKNLILNSQLNMVG